MLILEHLLDDDPIQKLKHVDSLNCVSKSCQRWVDQGFLKAMRMKPIVRMDDVTYANKLGSTVLDVSFHHNSLETIEVSAAMRHVQVVTALGCRKLDSVVIRGLTNLREVNLTGSNRRTCVRLSDSRLNKFPVHGFHASFLELIRIRGLKTVNVGEFSLARVHCSDMRRIGPGPDLGPDDRVDSCKVLKALHMSSMYKLMSVELTSYINLVSVSMCTCSRVTSLDLSRLTRLRFVVVKRCKRLLEIHLGGCISIQKLQVESCNHLDLIDVTGCSKAFVNEHTDTWSDIGPDTMIVS